MKLHLILVFVLVCGAIEEEDDSFLEEEEVEEDGVEEFIFTATVLDKVWDKRELQVVLTLEESQHPQVKFDLSLRSQDPAGKVLLREEAVLTVNELKTVVLNTGNFTWEMADLVITASPVKYPQIVNEKKISLKRVTSDLQVFIQVVGLNSDGIGYRVIAVDEFPEVPKFMKISVENQDRSLNVTSLKVPESGNYMNSLSGKFGFNYLEVSVASNFTPKPATTPTISFQSGLNNFRTQEWLSVDLETKEQVYFSNPNLGGSVTLKSLEGVPLEGHCQVILSPSNHSTNEVPTRFRKKFSSRNLTLEGATPTGGFEFDVVRNLEPVKETLNEISELEMFVTCTHSLSGSKVTTSKKLSLLRNLFDVGLRVDGPLISVSENSTHPKRTVVLKFLVERKDGGSVKEENPSKGLHVKLLLSEETLDRLRPSATNFSLPIPENGVVRLQFQANDVLQFSPLDKVQLRVGDVVKLESLEEPAGLLTPTLHAFLLHPEKSIHRGDVVPFHVRSCLPYSHLNVILSSSKQIYSSRRVSFKPKKEGGKLDEVIELIIPTNVTEGSLNFIVYGVNEFQGPRQSKKTVSSASAKFNVILSSGPQEIKIVDQFDHDMRTTVVFRLEGLPKNSVVSLQGVTLKTPSEKDKDWRTKARKSHPCEDDSDLVSGIRDDSPGDFDVSKEVRIESNADFNTNHYTTDRKRYNQLFFFEVNNKTSTEDNEPFIVTDTFDRLTHFGTIVISGATFNSESGRIPMSNSPVLKILPAPVTLTLYVAPSVLLGETLEVLGYVKNNLDDPFEGNVTMQTSEGGSTKVTEKLVTINPNSYKILKFDVTPRMVGDLVVSLRTNISSRLTATEKVVVSPSGISHPVVKHIFIRNQLDWTSQNSNKSKLTFELPPNCTKFDVPKSIVVEDDLLSDIFAFTGDEVFKADCTLHGGVVPRLQILSSLYDFYKSKADDEMVLNIRTRASRFCTQYENVKDTSIADKANKVSLGFSKIRTTWELEQNAEKRWTQLKSLQLADGSFQFPASGVTSLTKNARTDGNEKKQKTPESDGSAVIIDTAFALLALVKVNGSEIDDRRETELTLNFPASDFNRGVEFLRRMTFARRLEDNFPLSVIAFLFSQIKDVDAPMLLALLETTASNDTDGTFWTSKWKDRTLSERRVSSVEVTSFALMTYVNQEKQDEASEIAGWLVSKKNALGIYATFEETAVAVESLSRYATFMGTVKGEWPSLVRKTQNCNTPRKNVSNVDDFLVKVSLKNEREVLSLDICAEEDKLHRLMVFELTLPSGYFRKGDGKRNLPFRFTMTPPKCYNVVAHRMVKVKSGNHRSLTGSLTYYDLKVPLMRNVILFDATSSE